MPTIDDLRAAGYTAEPAMFAASARPTVYFVAGPGVQNYVAEDDAAMIQGLLDNPRVKLAAMPEAKLLKLAERLEVEGAADMSTSDLIVAVADAQTSAQAEKDNRHP